MKIKINIVPNDTNIVAKVVLLDEKNNTLFLRRSKHLRKFANKWDLPGGHLKANETLESGLLREVKEETNLILRKPIFVKTFDNIHFFRAKYDSQPIKLSSEHVEYRFFKLQDLDKDDKFQKVAILAIELSEIEKYD